MKEDHDFREKTDEELVALVLKNQEHFAYLIKRYEVKLASYVRRISSFEKEEIEDVLQEVFIKTYKNLNDFDRGLKFSSWIYRITRNQVISNYRKKKARPQSITWKINEEVLNNMVSDFDVERKIDSEFLKQNISEVLQRVDKKYREVLILKFLEEKDYKEISDIIQKPTGTVSSWINRAKKKFRKELEKQKVLIT